MTENNPDPADRNKPGGTGPAPHFFSSLRVRLFILVLVSLAPAMLLVLYMAAQQYRKAHAEVEDKALRLMRVAAADHAQQIAAGGRLLLALAKLPEIRAADPAHCALDLSGLVSRDTGFPDLDLIDGTGKRICNWPGDLDPISAGNVALAREAIASNRLVAGGYRFETKNGKAKMHLAYPVATESGRTPAALVLSYDLSHIGTLASSGILPEGAVTAIMDSRGSLLFRHPDPGQWIGRQISDTALAQTILGGQKEGTAEIAGFDGITRLFAFAPLRLPGAGEQIYFHVGMPSELAYKGVNNVLAFALGGLGAASLLILFLAWLGGNALIARPMAALVKSARRLGEGIFSSRTGLNYASGEIGQLARVFDETAQALQSRQFELENLKFALDEHAIISIADPAGRIVYANDRFCQISQYSLEELLGQDHRIVNSGHHPKAFFVEMWQTIGAGLVWHGEVCNRRKDGSPYWVATTIAPVIGTDGLLCQYISIRTDITRMMETQETLRHSEANFREVTETMSAGVILHRGGNLIYINRAAEEMSGFSQQELLAWNYRDIAHEESRELISTRGQARLRGETVPSRYEFRLNTKDGTERWIDLAAGVVEFDGEKAVMGTFIDVTERRRAEEALRHAHDDLERLVEQRTTQLSRARQDLEEDVARRRQIEAELIEHNSKLAELNRQLGEAQNQLVQSEKLASIGQLAAGVAHEINNPIGYVQSNLGSLENYLRDLLDMLNAYEAAEPALAKADTAAEASLRQRRQALDIAFIKEDLPNLMNESKEGITRVRKIVQDLKDFSRVDSTAEWEFADLHKCLDSTLNVVGNEIKYKADVVREYGALPDVECLPSQLNQVFMNLLVNAAHAIEGPRGTITIRSGTTGDQAWVEIADTGKGIGPENLGRIFDPFFTTKPVGKGTGLGLSLAYGIIQKHNGRIEVKSEVGHGTTFRVSVPVEHIKEDEPAASPIG